MRLGLFLSENTAPGETLEAHVAQVQQGERSNRFPGHSQATVRLRALLKVGLAQREVGEDGLPKKGGKIVPHVIVHDFRAKLRAKWP